MRVSLSVLACLAVACGGAAVKQTPPGPTAEERAATDKQACESGNMGACVSLARSTATGQGVAASPLSALLLFQRACGRLHKDACYEVGVRTEETDFPGSIAAFRRACSKGHGEACYRVGALHLDGRGVAKDENLAVFLLKKSCEQNSGNGCAAMADLHAQPTGDWSNEDKAYANYRRACELGTQRACQAKNSIKGRVKLTSRSAPTVNSGGVRFSDMTCFVQLQGAFALSAVVKTLAGLNACGVGSATPMQWEWDDTIVNAVRITGGLPAPASACLERALKASRPPRSGRCKGTFNP